VVWGECYRWCATRGGTVVKVVAYYRVSTARQGASGLGLDAQRAAVATWTAANGAAVLAGYTEVESGKRADRPELGKALAHAKRSRATLVIAKLDRLSRNVHFLSGLMESGVDFIACDNPHANKLTIHILAAVAEDEAKRISERTRAALAAYKANKYVSKRIRDMYPGGGRARGRRGPGGEAGGGAARRPAVQPGGRRQGSARGRCAADETGPRRLHRSRLSGCRLAGCGALAPNHRGAARRRGAHHPGRQGLEPGPGQSRAQIFRVLMVPARESGGGVMEFR
jgi:hypothetical protein